MFLIRYLKHGLTGMLWRAEGSVGTRLQSTVARTHRGLDEMRLAIISHDKHWHITTAFLESWATRDVARGEGHWKELGRSRRMKATIAYTYESFGSRSAGAAGGAAPWWSCHWIMTPLVAGCKQQRVQKSRNGVFNLCEQCKEGTLAVWVGGPALLRIQYCGCYRAGAWCTTRATK